MLGFFSILHFLGASFLIGGEPLVAIIAVKAEKDDNALKFFTGFIRNVAIFMWIGVGLTLVGGFGMFFKGGYPANTLFYVKMLLFALVIIISILLLVKIPKVQAKAKEDFANLRKHPDYKLLDVLSRIDMLLIMAILAVSAFMYK